MYDLKWRPVATYRGTDANPKERFIFHNAGGGGLGGRGSSSYIDAVIMRDRDANAGWTAASDATLEERRYYCQNWRADVVALLESDGDVSEWVRYSAYGEATVYPFVNGDYNADGSVDVGDTTAFLTDQDNSANAADVDRSGAVDGDDVTAFYASWDNGWMSTAWTSGGGLPSNAGQLSVTSGNRIGYAGYQFDPATEQYHVRHRVYSPEMGRWTRRDPLGYVDGMALCQYVGGNGLTYHDSSGLARSPAEALGSGELPAATDPNDDITPVDGDGLPLANPRIKKCCRIQRNNMRPVPPGVTICCGKPVTCLYDDVIRAEADGNERAASIIRRCVIYHERGHHPHLAPFCLANCDPDLIGSPCNANVPDRAAYCFECERYLAEALCLGLLRLECGRDEACKFAVDRRIRANLEKAKVNCVACLQQRRQAQPGGGGVE